MFCPECKAEFRFGFTHCADCDVDLVETLDAINDKSAQDAAALAAPELLWSGVDTGTLEQIRSSLDDADIPYNDEPLEARLLYASMRNPLEIWVQKSDLDSPPKKSLRKFSSATMPLRTTLPHSRPIPSQAFRLFTAHPEIGNSIQSQFRPSKIARLRIHRRIMQTVPRTPRPKTTSNPNQIPIGMPTIPQSKSGPAIKTAWRKS